MRSYSSRSSRDSLLDLWSIENFSLYRAVMAINRFQSILLFIRFDNSNTREVRQQTDKAAPISELWTVMNHNLHHFYKPSENLTVDEQLFPYRGRTRFTQHIPSKPAKYGIYPLLGQIYTGQALTGRETNQGERVEKDLLKAVQLSCNLEVNATAEVKFDSDLPEFRTTGGANSSSRKHEVFVQPVMWVKAIDIVLDRLVMQGADLSTVTAIGGSAQQHGSLYWSRHGVQTLKNLDSEKFLHLQIDDSAFTVNRTPIWMDGSTEKQCIEMETAIGGRAEMVEITGSKCYARFTGPQIRKIYQERSNAYEETQRISLVSSFLASVFLGDIAPIDYGDASGTNLFDIKAKTWSKQCLNSCAPDLEDRLGTPVPTSTIVGNICNFFVQRFGFSPECKITAFTGDNLSAMSGMVIEQDCLIMSLGTSDTLMMQLKEQPHLEEGHVLCHPTEINEFTGLLCFRNGSLVRDSINKIQANADWSKFNEFLDSTPRGNYGNMALHFHSLEIIPHVKGVLRWTRNNSAENFEAARGVQKFLSPQTEIRALIEGQMLHKRAVAADMGFHFGVNTKIIATGGASVNKSILQVISDVFNAPVFVQIESEAALFGAAYRAKYALYLDSSKSTRVCNENDAEHSTMVAPLSYHDYITKFIPNHLQLVCEPSKDCVQIYLPMLERYRNMALILAKT